MIALYLLDSIVRAGLGLSRRPSWAAGIGVLNSERTSAHTTKRFFCARSMAGVIWGSSERGFSEPYANPLTSATLLLGVNGGGLLISEGHFHV